MFHRLGKYLRKKLFFVIILGFILGCIFILGTNKVIEVTSTPESCEMCHVITSYSIHYTKLYE